MIQIDKEKIGAVIGPGGKMIRRIIEETGATIDVEDDGTVMISGMDQASIDKAVDWVKGLTQQAEVGQEYTGKVSRIVPFGAFVTILPGKDGLIHISKLADGYLAHPSDVVNEGDTIAVRVAEIDEQDRVNLVPVTPFAAPPSAARPMHDRPYPRPGFDRSSGPRRPRPFDRDRTGSRPGRKPYYER